MANKVGPLIKEARGKANLSQEALAGKIEGLSASDLGKAERGEKELSQSTLRQIAKLTGVTQSSLINAAKESTYGAAKKPTAAKKTATTTAKKTTTAAKKTTATASKNAVELTAAEKKLVELYREADSSVKKKAIEILRRNEPVPDIGATIETLLNGAMDLFK